MTGPQPFDGDPAAWAAMLENVRHAFAAASAGSDGPVNWELANQLANNMAAENDREVTADEEREVSDSLHLADLWLDEVTILPSGAQRGVAWTRQEWVAQTQPAWKQLSDPLASRVVEAMTSQLGTDAEDAPEQLRGMLPPEVLGQLGGQLSQIFAGVGGVVFGAQLGKGIGTLSGEVLSATDIGLPLGPAGTAALVTTNLAEYAAGLERPIDEVRLYASLREAAHHRLYQHVPWLRSHVIDAVTAYARGIVVDREAFEDALDRLQIEVDAQNPESMQLAISEGLFTPAQTPQQKQALARLELALALVEGWVSHVVDSAANQHLPSTAALSEASRRRRAAGGPAEQTFATLVGLELRPRKLREAAALWELLEQRRKVEGRDGIWQHPDLLPTTEDLDNPEEFTSKAPGVEIPGIEDL
ncbi:MAG TPA: zinc-dependent metalloprotease [Mycobacteriales bacterium]|jgi:putative hydrolase|nr:zinc-dependent metalloprotease [Mycobacteriales bacterium]